MAYADTDGSLLIAVEEATFNTTPANSTNWKTVRAKGWSVKPNIATVESEELSTNIDVREVITATKSAQVSLQGEYAKDADFELMLEHVFRSAFATNVLKGGILKKSMSVEEKVTGTAAEYAKVSGVRWDSFQMQGQVGQPIQTSFTGMGGAVSFGASSAVGTGSIAAAGTNRIMTLADMTTFSIAGDTTTLCVLDFNLSVANSLREQFGAGSTGIYGIGYGTRRVTGSFTAYFETREQFTAFNNGSARDISLTLSDGTNSHLWRIPRAKITDGEKAIQGRSQDITQRFDFTATYDSTAATSVMVTRAPS